MIIFKLNCCKILIDRVKDWLLAVLNKMAILLENLVILLVYLNIKVIVSVLDP